MPDSSLLGHAVVALGLTAIFAGAPAEPDVAPTPNTPPSAAVVGMVALQPFDEQFVPTPSDEDDAAPAINHAAVPPDIAFGLFAA